jgi:hypothetical protein
MSHVCVCGNPKENVKQRYCNACQKFHHVTTSVAHKGKGTGPRKFGWNRRYAFNYARA